MQGLLTGLGWWGAGCSDLLGEGGGKIARGTGRGEGGHQPASCGGNLWCKVFATTKKRHQGTAVHLWLSGAVH
jgi:hypothetical protein